MQDNGTDENLHPTSRENVASEAAMNDKEEITNITQDTVEDVLPSSPHANFPDFQWGDIDGMKVIEDIDEIYSEIRTGDTTFQDSFRQAR